MELRHNSTLLFLPLPLFLRLNRDLEAPLLSESVLTLLLLGLLFLLPPLIQRAKQRVCWRSFNVVQSRQDWQVRLEMPQVILKQEVRTQTTERSTNIFFVCLAADLEVPVQQPGLTEATVEGGASSVSVSAPKVSIPSSAHHFCFSLDLRSLGGLRLTHSIAATLR